MGTTRELIQERQKEYGDAWLATGAIVRYISGSLREGLLQTIERTGYAMAWFQILNKLVRLLYNPHHLDSWKDIAGWATLVTDEMEERNESK